MLYIRQSKIYKLSDSEFIRLVHKYRNYSDILRFIGLSTKGGNATKLLKKRINDLNIDISHFEKPTEKAISVRRRDLDTILIKDSDYMNISRLKKRLVSEGRLEYKCDICGNEGIWNDKALTLQLDHINGVNKDHRINNIRFLCPNCHSQTSTYSGRNLKNKSKKSKLCISCGQALNFSKSGLCNICSRKTKRKVERPSKEVLTELIKNNSYVSLGEKYNVSDNAIRKWAKSYNLI